MYTLYFPFRLLSFHEIVFDKTLFSVGSLTCEFKRDNDIYKLILEGFNTEDDARSYIKNILTALAIIAIEKNIPFEYQKDISDIVWSQDPIQAAKNINDRFNTNYDTIDGMGQLNTPHIYLTSKKITFSKVPQISIKLQNPLDVFQELLAKNLQQNPIDFSNHPKLETTLQLYQAMFTENSSNARFLTLVIALECLANATTSSNKRNPIMIMIEDTLTQVGDSEAKNKSQAFDAIYNLRNKLVHEGKVDDLRYLKQQTEKTRNILRDVLLAKIRQIIEVE